MLVTVPVKNYSEIKDALRIFVIMLFFQGRQVIQPEELVSRENDLSTLIGKVDKPTEIKRYRDVVRKASIHGEYVIIGVEHQSTFDEKMIFRILNYDATIYINQVESKQEV